MGEAARGRCMRWQAAAIALLMGLAIALGARVGSGEPPRERTPGIIEIHGSPHGIDPYVIVDAFPNLKFERPVWIGSPGDHSNNLFVMEQGGRVLVFENTRDVEKASVVLDLRKKVHRSHNEEGMLGMAFHPQFKKNRQVFIAYSAGNPRRLVLSRFEASSTRKRIRANTEEVILRQRQPFGNHNGGGLAFGPDGFLYVSLGDGGSLGDPEDNAQNLNNWLGTILRIDVSRRRGFNVPQDNPFVDVPHTRPEIWAYGLQNPRRFSFDRMTGDLWAGDVGNVRWQEVDLIKKGGNYGWNLREGKEQHKKGRSLVNLDEPLLALGGEDARRITGGYVYRGKRLPDLIGAYVYGDTATGTVWALRREGDQVKENILIGRGRGVSSFGEDEQGEIYFTTFDGKVHTLSPWSGHRPKGRFPRRLSDSGLFTDMVALTPHPCLIEYSVNVPYWSDGAHKQRYLMLPGSEKIRVGADGRFEFPQGTIFVMTFYLGDERKGPLPGGRLETRLFIRGERDWNGYTYVWNDDQTDAILLDGRLDQPRLTGASGGEGVSWTYPSRSDCMSCHTEAAGRVLGFRVEQLDRHQDHGDSNENQLEVFTRLGLFDGDLPKPTTSFPDWTGAEPGDTAALRAYLDVNCAICHQPAGPGNALIDLRFTTAEEDMNLVDRAPGQWDFDVYGGRLVVPGRVERSLMHLRMSRTGVRGMPPLSHNVPDAKALRHVEAWIEAMAK